MEKGSGIVRPATATVMRESKRQIALDGRKPRFGADIIVVAARHDRHADGADHLSSRVDGQAAADHHHAGQILDGLLS